MEFKVGENGPYASCDVVMCDFWSGKPEEIKEHVTKVHEWSEEDAEEMVEEFIDFVRENSGEKISIENTEDILIKIEDSAGDKSLFTLWDKHENQVMKFAARDEFWLSPRYQGKIRKRLEGYFSMEEEDARGLVQKIIQELEDYEIPQGPAPQEGTEWTDEVEELDVDEEEIVEFLEEEPLYKLCGQTDAIHKNDAALKMLSWESGLSRVALDFPLNLWPIGSSGAGKTHLLKTMALTIPNEHLIQFDVASPKAMYYFCEKYGNEALSGKIAFFNEVEASDSAKVLLRSLTDPTKERNRLLSVKDQEVIEIDIEGLPVAWFTSVDPLEDEQLKNRFVMCNPSEELPHKEEIANHQLENIQEGILQPIKLADFPLLKASFRKIVEETRDKKVKIFYDWEWNYAENSRLQPFFGALVMASAKIHYRQRPMLDDTILATLEDFYIAKIVFDKVFKQTMSRVKDKDLEIYQYVPSDELDALKRSGIAQEAGTSTNVVRHSLRRLVEADLVNSEKSGSGQTSPWTYWKTEKGFASFAMEISRNSLSPDELFAKLEKFNLLRENNERSYRERHNDLYESCVSFSLSYMENLREAVNMSKKDFISLFEDYLSREEIIEKFAKSEEEKEELKRESEVKPEKETQPKSEIETKLIDLLKDGPVPAGEVLYEFDIEEFPSVKKVKARMRGEDRLVEEEGKWKLVSGEIEE